MKRVFVILLAIITLCVSCQPSGSEEQQVDATDSKLTVLLPSITRLALGGIYVEKYPVVWSDEDCILANGTISKDILIDQYSAQKATFSFDRNIKYPCCIVYPHDCEFDGEKAKVEFQADQYHTEDAFTAGKVPMSGYAKEDKGAIPLTTLVGLLRLKMEAKSDDILLASITVTSESGKRLSGEFSLYVPTATISPTANSSTSITYHLPEGYTLSTDETNIFTIIVPATNLGTCNVVFTTVTGASMKMKWVANTIKPNSIHEQKPITFEQGASGSLQPLKVEEDAFQQRYSTIKGYVLETDGTPIEGVAVSDGFSVVQTDKNGFYAINITQDAWYIIISIPEEYQIPTNKYGLPCFFKKYPGFSEWFNFTLDRIPGGKETEFMLFGLADPQVSRTTHIERFSKQVAPEIKYYISTLGKPCYGITLGDVISMGSTDLTNTIRPAMRDAMHAEKVGHSEHR